jgi:hypothetical protein
MTSSKSNYLNNSSGHVDALIEYVLDTKPFRTKLSEIAEKYLFEDSVSIAAQENNKFTSFLGADILPKTPVQGRRPRRSNTWRRDVISDGARLTWPVPPVSISNSSLQDSRGKFIAGTAHQNIFPGVTSGVFDPIRWDGPGMASVFKNGTLQQDSIDYFLSHGAFIFETRTASRWKETPTAQLRQFPEQEGSLRYNDVIRSFGRIMNISGGNFEEWYLKCTSVEPAILEVRGSSSGIIGSAQIGLTFSHPNISFEFKNLEDEVSETIIVDDVFTLTPSAKITVSPTAQQETWSLIKVNPIVLEAAPVFSAIETRAVQPQITVHVANLDRAAPQTNWRVRFTGSTSFNLIKTVGTQVTTIAGIQLNTQNSYRNNEVGFTLLKGSSGFVAGEEFSFTTKTVQNYLVHGSTSGWMQSAGIGQWYWNGHIGFKVPQLECWVRAFNTTIVSSVSAADNSWATTVSNNQILNSVEYNTDIGAFLATGEDVAVISQNGADWTPNFGSVVSPTSSKKFIIVGGGGSVVTSTDGVTWYEKSTGVTNDLNSFVEIPNFLTSTLPGSSPNSINCVIAVGNDGTIITSTDYTSWAVRNSGTAEDLLDITWSPDSIIAVGANGTILRSVDRISWTTISCPVQADLQSVIWVPDRSCFIAVGSGGTILKSIDGGLTWLDLAIFNDCNFSDIVYGGGKFVAVSYDGWVATSADTITWIKYLGPKLNSISYGSGKFIGVGGRNVEIEEFTQLHPVHSFAAPSTYTITFNSATTATVYNNIKGDLGSLTLGQPWSDDWVSFRLDGLSTYASYSRGDVVKIFLSPSRTVTLTGWYDDVTYERWGYDMGTGNFADPYSHNQEIFPLMDGHGAVIFKNVQPTDEIKINRITRDTVRLQILGSYGNSLLNGDLADWVPLEFRYFGQTGTMSTAFSDQASRIEAFLCANANQRVFTISQLPGEAALLSFDPVFFSQHLPVNARFTLLFLPDSTFSQKLAIKFAEKFSIHQRFRFNFNEVQSVSISDSDVSTIDIFSDLQFADVINVTTLEGGALPVKLNEINNLPIVSVNGVVVGLVETQPGDWVWTGVSSDWAIPKPTAQPSVEVESQPLEIAGTAFAEALTIIERVASIIQKYNANYNITTDTPAGGIVIPVTAQKYIITHNSPQATPTLIVESLSNPGSFTNPLPSLNTYDADPSIISRNSFMFELPPGFTAPFRLIVT